MLLPRPFMRFKDLLFLTRSLQCLKMGTAQLIAGNSLLIICEAIKACLLKAFDIHLGMTLGKKM